mgnify:CR=1 FL=1
MKIFIDTANLKEIETVARWGILSGVTTNPTLMAKEGPVDMEQVIREITRIGDESLSPVESISVEVLSLDAEGMVEEARRYARWSPYATIKIPMTEAGLEAVSILSREGIKTNVTLVFTPNQGLLAARAGATYISPFVGRLDDISTDGLQTVRDLAHIFRQYGIATQIIAASIRHPLHVIEAARAGAHIATIPFKVLEQMVKHPLTDAGIKRFLADWEAVFQSVVRK